jgi:beta-glucosidase
LKQEKLARSVLFTTHGAQEVGHAISGAIAGKFSPAGRLSQTWYFDESVLPDYNDYDIIKNKCTYLYHEKPVLHPFGYGLSYTSFEYGKLSAKNTADVIEFSFTVRNSGKIDSDEVPQLYFASNRKDVPRPQKQLCAFTRMHLKAGAEKTVALTVPHSELLFCDEAGKNWAPDNCSYRFMLGTSSADIRQEITREQLIL